MRGFFPPNECSGYCYTPTVFLPFVQQSEPSIFIKYQTKPQLFDEEIKEKASLHFGAGRVKNILENFEVNKNKIKDKYDRYVKHPLEILSVLVVSTPCSSFFPSSKSHMTEMHFSSRKVSFQVLNNL